MTSKEIKRKPSEAGNQQTVEKYFLMLHNDEVHSFDYVIEALMEICNHSHEQATQCTFITHHKGSCDIRKGEYEKLRRMKNALINKELIVTIEQQP
ncbi:MAG TPA: ATP-dependent Clp protease adaptor ClpS [Mariniphaga sp.]|nr:ATP-dependent Clp protease adaptor ClpS [Mariniphaga sp.]